jgi:parallel beta-helix repeat protein
MKKIFFFLFFASFLMANLSALTYVNNCTDLNITGETYMLSADIYSLSPIRINCFVISAENVTLDGNGYTLYGDGGGKGVYSNQNGTIIQNLVSSGAFTFEPTIYFGGVDNGKIIFSNISASSVIDIPILLTGSSGNNISYNRVSTAGILASPLIIQSSSNNNFISRNIFLATGGSSKGVQVLSSSNNSFLENNITSSLDRGIYLEEANNTSLFRNIIAGAGEGSVFASLSGQLSIIENNITPLYNGAIKLSSSPNSNLVSNEVFTPFGFGFYLVQSSNTNLSFNKARGTSDSGLALENSDNMLVQENVITSTTGDYAFSIWGSGTGITLLNQDIAGTYYLEDTEDLKMKNSYGQIFYNETINAEGTDFSADILILNNSVYTNTDSGINQSAIIEFYDLEEFTNPIILRNGVSCSVGICSNLTIAGNDYSFFVTSWSNYSIGEAPEIPEEPEPQPEQTFGEGQVIYETLNTGGAGLGKFMVYMGQSLPFLFLILFAVGLIFLLGKSIGELIIGAFRGK